MRWHRRALPLLLAEGRLRLIRVKGDERTIGVFYGIASGGWWGNYLAGYDREWAGRDSSGQIVLASAVDMAVREGATEFDFLKGAERIKYVWPGARAHDARCRCLFGNLWGPADRARRATRDAAAAGAVEIRAAIPPVPLNS